MIPRLRPIKKAFHNKRVSFNKKVFLNKKALFNKKAFSYLIITSFIVAVLLIVFLANNRYKYEDQQSLYQMRIKAMNDFVKNFNNDVHRATYISAFRTLVALEDTVSSNGEFLNDTESSFRETFFYGTIDNVSAVIMQNSSFQDYIDKIKLLADQVGIRLTVNITRITLSQPDPWSIDVHVFADVNMTDTRRIASWLYTKEFITNVPIDDLRDPIYGKFTLNKVPNTIRRLNFTYLVLNNVTTNLQILLNGSYYIASNYSPNFLERFEGINTADPNGIESIVNIRSLADQDLVVFQDMVKVDFIYFNNISSDAICNVQNMPSSYYFVIPSNRIGLYNLTGMNYSVNCT